MHITNGNYFKLLELHGVKAQDWQAEVLSFSSDLSKLASGMAPLLLSFPPVRVTDSISLPYRSFMKIQHFFFIRQFEILC